MSGRKGHYPNNWEAYKNTPDENFIPHTFAEVMTWKVAGWELPSSVFCIIRAMDRKTKKVTEMVYQRPGSAQNKVNELMKDPNMEMTVVDHESIHFVSHANDSTTDS
jgi:hypothetical protein